MTDQPKICLSCGTKNNPVFTVCWKCGLDFVTKEKPMPQTQPKEDTRNVRMKLWKVLLGGSLLLLLLSASHAHVLPDSLFVYWDWDINQAMVILGIISFVLSCLLMPVSKIETIILCLFFLPLIFTGFFSLFEISSEFNPDNISKGWGIIYIAVNYPASLIGVASGLLVGWCLSKIDGRLRKR